MKAIYTETWERICAQEPKLANLAKLVLLWITHAQTELTIDTLRRAVATSPETHAFDPKRMVPKALLLSVCCGLVSLDEKTTLVRLIRELHPCVLKRLYLSPPSLQIILLATPFYPGSRNRIPCLIPSWRMFVSPTW
jgi:ankyrin repeat domain-containing protein 50